MDHEVCAHSAALILAAGKGTRMCSNKPKVLHTLLGEPLLFYVISALRPLFGSNIWVVIGHGSSLIQSICSDLSLNFIYQEKQLGTANAVSIALPVLQQSGIKRLMVINGDMPLITSDLLECIIKKANKTDFVFASLKLPLPNDYGQVLRREGKVYSIIEAKDIEPSLQHDNTVEVNAGLYYFSLEVVDKCLPMIKNENKSQEYYFTDIIELAVKNGYLVDSIYFEENRHFLGVNTPKDLSYVESVQQAFIVEKLLQSGVIIHYPESVRISPFAIIEPGVEIYGPCEIYGASYIASGSIIYSHSWIKNTTISHDVCIYSFCHLDTVIIKEKCYIGPYARLRPGCHLEEQVCIGNFVEIKKTQLGKHVKINHLSYVGDAIVGDESNIGAGTITCNYDGENKHHTFIGKKAFIGSNTALVAPLTIGEKSLIGAGSVIIRDVPENMVSIARGKQKNFSKRK